VNKPGVKGLPARGEWGWAGAALALLLSLPPPLFAGEAQAQVVTIPGGEAVTEGTAAQCTVSRSGAATSALTVLLTISEDENSGRGFVASSNEGNREIPIPIGAATAT